MKLSYSCDVLRKIPQIALAFLFLLAAGEFASAQQVENGLLHVGGFRCASIKPLKNDSSLDLYHTGYWNYTGFRMEVWRRLGVPFWYPKNTGVVRVAGEGWRPDLGDDISSAEAGGKASEPVAGAAVTASAGIDPHVDDENAASSANDGDKSTAWAPAGQKSNGKLTVTFAAPARVNRIRFLSNEAASNTPRDYAVGLILPDGSAKEIASISGEYSIGGTWREFAVPGVEAKGIYLSIRSSNDGKQAPMVNELEAKGEFVSAPAPASFPSQVVIPMGGYAGTDLHFIGNVGAGFPATPEARTPVGEYVVHYSNGDTEDVPLVAGKNVADVSYGHLVPEAQFAYGLKPHDPAPGHASYHLEQMLQVEAKSQLMFFTHHLGHSDWPVQSVEFRCTRAGTSLLLAAVTLEQSGPHISPLFYGGKMVRPYPADAPAVPPSPLEGMKDRSRELSLDGDWSYTTDPGDEGIRKQFFTAAYDASSWKTMAVPSQWYVKGLDYNGAVWFRREIQVPASFPGSVAELDFGGVDYEARVWVNGVYVGRHIGAYSSFKINVTSALHKGAANLVVVRVDCPIDPGYESEKTLIKGNTMDDIMMPYGQEGSMGGIYRSLALRAHGDAGIDNLWAAAQLSEDLKHADVQVKLDLDNSAASGTVEVRATLIEPNRPGVDSRRFTATASVKLSSGQIPVELAISVDSPLLWYPWEQGTPYLHRLQVDVLQDGQVLDRQFIQVGLRQVEFNDKEHYVLVNHHRIFLKGVLNDDIHWRSLMDRRGYAQRIQMQKDANINIIRMIAHQSSPEMYELCDEMGMMIWQEMPLQWGYSRTEAIHQDILDVVRQTIEQTRSHASVVGWSAWNEGGQPEFSDRITAMIRTLDGTRPMTRASGHGEFDVHIYPNMTDGLQGRTSLWTGYALNFVSETGSYGLSSEEAVKEMAGDDYFHFDSVDPMWDNFDSYRWSDDPVFRDSPKAAVWPIEKIKQYYLAKIKPSEHFYAQYHKFQYENARAQRFAPTTALIHCRFDDAYPLAYSGAPVNFTGRPKPAYFALQNANRAVLPILFFDFEGAKDVRVVNDYWFKSWDGAKLTYRLRTRDGKVVKDLTRIFDLPSDSTVSVISREDTGDVWHVPGGFFADLTVSSTDGQVLSENHYDFTEQEVQTFVTSVYPLAPIKPANSVVLTAEQATFAGNVGKKTSEGGTYSRELLQTSPQGAKPRIKFTAEVLGDSDYYIRVSASSGKAAHGFDLAIDGKKAALETYDVLDANEHLTRDVYNTPDISWYPGWKMRLSKGKHQLVFTVPDSKPTPELLFDAIALQSYKELPDPFVIPGIRDLKAEKEVESDAH
jgi:beta-mannosidase